MILNFSNLSIFTQATSANIKLSYLQSAVSWAKVDGFKRFEIMVVCLDLMMENDEKQYEFSIVFYDFSGNCRVDRF